MKYINKLTQEDKILEALKSAGERGVHPSYFIINLHIFQYNARIFGLRDKIGCTCGQSEKCSSSEHIVSKPQVDGTNKFYYKVSG